MAGKGKYYPAFEPTMLIETAGHEAAQAKKPHTINVRVRYAAAAQPFVEPHTEPSDTLEAVKARAMTHFQLTEGPVPSGGTKVYLLSFNRIVQSNLQLTIGELVGDDHSVELLLVEQFNQG